MATSPLRLQQGYGIGNALQPLPPFSIIANRAPTQQDKARIGTFWVYTALNNVYVLTSVTGGVSNWLTLSNGGAGVFLSLTVNGPSIFAGNITQTAGVTSLLATTTTGLTNNGVFTQNGNTVINACPVFGALNVLEDVADTVIYTQSARANGSRHLLCRQASADQFSVIWTTVKSRAGAVVQNGDELFQQNFVARGNTGESNSARIQVTAGNPVPASAAVPSSLAIWTTNAAGVLAQKLDISSEGQISIIAAGQTLGIKQGANAMAGTVVLDGATGSFTQANTQVTNAGSIILLSRVNVNGASGAALTYTIVDNTSFTVTARDATTGLAVNTDASTIAYMIVQLVP